MRAVNRFEQAMDQTVNDFPPSRRSPDTREWLAGIEEKFDDHLRAHEILAKSQLAILDLVRSQDELVQSQAANLDAYAEEFHNARSEFAEVTPLVRALREHLAAGALASPPAPAPTQPPSAQEQAEFDELLKNGLIDLELAERIDAGQVSISEAIGIALAAANASDPPEADE